MSDLRQDQPELHPSVVATLDLADEQSYKQANKRLQERLDGFKRAGAGYKCQCREYEAEIDWLRSELLKLR